MKAANLRWVFLTAAVLLAAWMFVRGASPIMLAAAAACGLLWFRSSRRKALSLDRESLGLARRRNPWRTCQLIKKGNRR